MFRVRPVRRMAARYRSICAGPGVVLPRSAKMPPSVVQADLVAPDPTFVGRQTELRLLAEALDAARVGRGQLVALVGEAGIGKSRLVEEIVRRIDLPPDRVLSARCPEHAGAPSYWPWSRALAAYATARGLDEFRRELGSDAALLAPILPAAVQEAGSGARAVEPAQPDARFLLLDAFVRLLRRIAASVPLVLVLEDVHWADEASLALLEFVAREARDTRLLVLVTYRERDRPRPPRSFTDAVRHGRRIAIRGLDRDAVTALVAQAASGVPSSALVDRLLRLTGGNPFFVSEVVRALALDGRLNAAVGDDAPLALPETVRGSIQRHLDPLSVEDRTLLELAAVAGDEFSVGALAAAGAGNADVVLGQLSAIVGSGLIVEGGAPGRFRFAHALIREALYGDLLPAARIHLHARVGTALETLYADDPEAPLGELAAHFLRAAPVGTQAKAVDYATRAAERAYSVHAHQDAVTFFEQALVALGPEVADRERRLALRLRCGDAALLAGLDPRARERFRQAVSDARALGNTAALVEASFGYALASARFGVVDLESSALLDEAVRALGDGDSVPAACMLSLRSYALQCAGDHAESAAVSETALAMARRLGQPPALTAALLARVHVLHGAGQTAERLAMVDEAVPFARHHPQSAHATHQNRALCLLEGGDVAGATREIDRMTQLTDRSLRAYQRWQTAIARTALSLLAGRFDEAASLAAEALALRRDASDPTALQHFVLQMFMARRETADPGGLAGSVRWLAEQHPQMPAWRCLYAVFLADLNRHDEAREQFERLAVHDFTDLPPDPMYPAALAWLTRVASYLFDARRAQLLYPLLLPFSERNIVVTPYVGGCLGSAERYLGLAAAIGGNPDAAEQHYRAGIAMNERMGARPVVACTQHEYARLLQFRGRPGDLAKARALLESAQAISLACGMTQLLEWIDRLGSPAFLGTNADAPDPQTASGFERPTPATRAVLRRDGEVWTVAFGAAQFRLKDTKGVQLLSTLLQNPRREIHALDLAVATDGLPDTPVVADRGDAGPLLDPAARTAYKTRLGDLRDELDEAERFNDPARAAHARHEIEFLTDELARGVGLGGRDRKAASAAERARVNATRTIGAVMKKIAAECPPLGEHLRATVRTGYVCVYAPVPGAPIHWSF